MRNSFHSNDEVLILELVRFEFISTEESVV